MEQEQGKGLGLLLLVGVGIAVFAMSRGGIFGGPKFRVEDRVNVFKSVLANKHGVRLVLIGIGTITQVTDKKFTGGKQFYFVRLDAGGSGSVPERLLQRAY